jgi:hypothetical protein
MQTVMNDERSETVMLYVINCPKRLHSDPEMQKTGINSIFLVLNHIFSNPIQG